MTEVMWGSDDNFDFGVWLQKFSKSRCSSNGVRESSQLWNQVALSCCQEAKSLSVSPCTIFLPSYLFALEKRLCDFLEIFGGPRRKSLHYISVDNIFLGI